MKITSISLTNFRSFKETQTIELAPVTLLFGPNSVGKSSVLMALAYVQQILEKGHCDPQTLSALGDKLIGGFRSLVHNGNLDSTIKIRLEFEMGATIFPADDDDYFYLANIFNSEIIELEDFGGSVETFAFEVEVAWANESETAYVRDYRVWVNGDYLGRLHCKEDLKNPYIADLNLLHAFALTSSEREIEPEHFTEGMLLSDLDDSFSDEAMTPSQTELEMVLENLTPGSAALGSDELLPEGGLSRSRPLGISCQWGAIPIAGDNLKTNMKYSDLEPDENHLQFLVIRNFLNHAFLHPLQLAKRFLHSYIAIGPMRVVPDFDYVPNPNPVQAGWSDGRAAWDLLHQNPVSNKSAGILLEKCNDWLSDEDRLDTGYKLKNWSMFETLEGQGSYDDTQYLSRKRHLVFIEKNNDVGLSASQLGMGISQVLPVIAAANYEKLKLVSIEQPELHLHPKLQVELGDLFIDCSKDRSFLIETHSEHLILRLLKRIRQTTDKELPENFEPISDSDISIVYLESTTNGVVVKKIRVDEDGEFIDRWPKGFFAERRKELM